MRRRLLIDLTPLRRSRDFRWLISGQMISVLGTQLTAATQMSLQLKKQLAEGDGVIRRISKIALAARPSSEAAAAPSAPNPPNAKALAAAAQAFSERRRTDGLAA